MKVDELIDLFGRSLDAGFRRALFVWGPPGIGKSDAARQAAASRGAGFVDVRLGQCDPTDLRGVLVYDPQKAKSVWVVPNVLPNGGSAPKGILFLDEINLAPPSVQASAYQLILDRRLGEYAVPDGWIIVAAGNRAEDSALVHEMPTPLMNRFVHVEVQPDFDTWKKWAIPSDVHPYVIGFLNYKKNLLCPKVEPGVTAFPTPRSWHFVSDVIKTFGMNTELIIGSVGQGAGTEFIAFGQMAAELSDLVESVANGENRIPSETSQVFFVLSALVSRAREDAKIVRRFLEYVQALAEKGMVEPAAAGFLDIRHANPEEYGRQKGTETWTRIIDGPLGAMAKNAAIAGAASRKGVRK